MIYIRVKLFASLRRFAPEGSFSGKPFEVNLPDGATLSDLARQLKLPASETKVTFVNGRSREMDWVLANDDEIGIFPPVGGG
jgi:molybdopterin synthase sulfur carrier subunit